MSIDLVAAALWLPLKPTRKLVLVSLCENADQYGLCWPSREYIASRCSMSGKSVGTHLQSLEKDGWLKVLHRGYRGYSTRRQLKAQRILREGEQGRQLFYLRGWGEGIEEDLSSIKSTIGEVRGRIGEVDALIGEVSSQGTVI